MKSGVKGDRNAAWSQLVLEYKQIDGEDSEIKRLISSFEILQFI